MRPGGFVGQSKIAARLTSLLPRGLAIRGARGPGCRAGRQLAKVIGFHLDEYLGLPKSHPASFRALSQAAAGRSRADAGVSLHRWRSGAEAECRRMGDLIRRHPIEVALVGIGENGHLAFNDPPADFQTEGHTSLLIWMMLAAASNSARDGFPPSMTVPRRAISMSIRQIMKSRAIVCSVPERRKAEAARAALEGPVTPQVPASILQQHPQAIVYVDPPAASLLQRSCHCWLVPMVSGKIFHNPSCALGLNRAAMRA